MTHFNAMLICASGEYHTLSGRCECQVPRRNIRQKRRMQMSDMRCYQVTEEYQLIQKPELT